MEKAARIPGGDPDAAEHAPRNVELGLLLYLVSSVDAHAATTASSGSMQKFGEGPKPGMLKPYSNRAGPKGVHCGRRLL